MVVAFVAAQFWHAATHDEKLGRDRAVERLGEELSGPSGLTALEQVSAIVLAEGDDMVQAVGTWVLDRLGY